MTESRVLIVMTGGTICMCPSADGLVPMDGFLDRAMAPRPSFNDGQPPVPLTAHHAGATLQLPSLRTPVSAYGRHIRYAVLEFAPLLDSSSISAAGWTAIAETVRDNYHLYDGFVVLHGTDSLAYTASALSFMMADLGKPVVLTGAQASIFALQSDAVDNLLGALVVAGTFVVPEVCLFFHHALFRGNRTTKVSAAAFAAFASPNAPPLARVTSLGLDVDWLRVRRPTRLAAFALTPPLDTAHVACFRIFPGLQPAMLDAVLRLPGLRGLVLETFGMGNAPAGVDDSLLRVVRDAVGRGIVIVNVSQCPNGFVSPLYAPATALGRAGVVFGHDLTTEAALTKLAALLAHDDLTHADVCAQMGRDLRGEMTCLTAPVLAHPEAPTPVAGLSPLESAFAVLGYAIAHGDRDAVDAMLAPAQPLACALLKAADYAGNTAVHLAASAPDTRLLRALLTQGASVHVRNHAGHTPLYLAEKLGLADNVALLRVAGAQLWGDETETDQAVNAGSLQA